MGTPLYPLVHRSSGTRGRGILIERGILKELNHSPGTIGAKKFCPASPMAENGIQTCPNDVGIESCSVQGIITKIT